MNENISLPEFMRNELVIKTQRELRQRKGYLISKRIFDIVVSLLLLVPLSIVFLVIAIAIKLEDGGPVFYRQERVTTNGRKFKIFKFRTMVLNADKVGPLVTQDHDPRITKVGRRVRNYRLDEVAQLLNVLIGDMSFVGARPEVQKYVDAYTPEMQTTLLLPAGVTSIAAIEFRHEAEKIAEWTKQGLTVDEAYIKHILPEKMQYNIDYLKKYAAGGGGCPSAGLGLIIRPIARPRGLWRKGRRLWKKSIRESAMWKKAARLCACKTWYWAAR